MIITREGCKAKHGKSSIELQQTSFKWDSASEALVIEDNRGTRDFSSESEHTYHIAFSTEELCKLINALGSASINSPKQIEKSLEPSVKSIYQLLAATTGTMPAAAGLVTSNPLNPKAIPNSDTSNPT